MLARLSREVEYVIAVNGNTDSVDLLRRMAEGTDVIVLDNEVIDLPFPELTLRIAGISLFGLDQRAEAAVDRIATAEQGVFRILLSHQPDEVFRLDPSQTVDLAVAGHTHGGQISLPFFGPPLTLSDVPRHVAAGGLHQLDGSWVYVSTGVGRERGRAHNYGSVPDLPSASSTSGPADRQVKRPEPIPSATTAGSRPPNSLQTSKLASPRKAGAKV